MQTRLAHTDSSQHAWLYQYTPDGIILRQIEIERERVKERQTQREKESEKALVLDMSQRCWAQSKFYPTLASNATEAHLMLGLT